MFSVLTVALKMDATLLLCLFCGLYISNVNCFGTYRQNIPNGNNVPHPCKPNYLWQGVGHQKKEGSGYRNPFGKDFATANHTWTKELCEKDSDGDGLTNGQELGDPQCIWTKGSASPIVDKLSHPGLCEPWTDPKCQEQLIWLKSECESDEFECDALKNDTDVKNMTLKFPLTNVPVEETTYMCMEFELDTSDDFHLIATQPIIDNSNVMHHAVLFGCSSTNHTLRSTPHVCGMVASRECGQIINVWTLGLSGTCYHDAVGFRIGAQGYSRVALQFHWNNPTLEANQKDQSGMILHYTKNRRVNDAGVLTIGADYLEIPARTINMEQTAICPGVCTSERFTGKTYIVSALNHMHYLGVRQQIEQFRNGVKVRDITNDMDYNYDDPSPIRFDTPIELLPGDTLTTKCVYNSQNRDHITYFGDATSAEMCYGFLTFYPKQNIGISFCTSWKSLPNCALYSNMEYNGCNYKQFRGTSTQLATELYTVCQAGCTQQCKDAIKTKFDSTSCLQGDFYDYTKYIFSFDRNGKYFFDMIESCVPPTTVSITTPGNPNGVMRQVLSPMCTLILLLNFLYKYIF